MAGKAKLEVEFVGDTRSLEGAFRNAGNSASGLGSKLGGLAKGAAIAAGAAGLGALFVTLKSGISEFTESARVAAQTEAVLKSTGGAANVTAKQVEDLASAIQRKSGIDDEAIASGENLLLTFTNIRNESGKGNDIFNQTVGIMADLSTALGQDTKASAIQLGKALNDPIRGLTALQRVGVSFTAAQKDQIKALVESGRTLDAQKLILAELTKEFGGSAEAAGKTLPGQLAILKGSFENLAGSLIGAAVPAVSRFVNLLTEEGLPKIEQFFGAISEAVGPTLENMGQAFEDAWPVIQNILESLAGIMRDVVLPIWQRLGEIAGQAIQKIGNILKQHGPEIRRIFQNIGEVIRNLALIVIPLLKFAFTVVLPVAIRILIPLLVAVSEALKLISTAVRVLANLLTQVLVAAFKAVVVVGQALVSFFTEKIPAAFGQVREAGRGTASVLRETVAGAFRTVRAAADAVADIFRWFKEHAVAIFRAIARGLKAAAQTMAAAFQPVLAVLNAVKAALDALLGAARAVKNAIDAIKPPSVDLTPGFNIPDVPGIPGLQHGGIVRRPTLAVVGEAGPEAVIPLGRSSAGAFPGGVTYNITVNMPNYLGDVRDAARQIRDEIVRAGRRNSGSMFVGQA